MKSTSKFFSILGIITADRFSSFVGSWTFIAIYSTLMIGWVVLHLCHILHVDSAEFTKLNLLLTYFAGTQASIILMSQTRQSYIDRKKQEANLDISKKLLELFEVNSKRMKHMMKNMDILEQLIDNDMESKDDK